MKSTTFHPLSPAHPHIGANLLSMTTRTASGKLITTPSLYPFAPAHDMGGSNLYSSAPDFLSLLTSLLRNDGCVLKRETVDLMLGETLVDKSVFGTEKVGVFLKGMVQEGVGLDHCLARIVNIGVLGTGRRKGGVAWQGATKCLWVSCGVFLLSCLDFCLLIFKFRSWRWIESVEIW